MASSSSLHDGAPSPLDSALLHLAGAALQYLEAELSQASTVGAAAAPAAGAGSWLPAAPGSGRTSEQGVSAAPSFAEEGKAAVAGPAVLASEPTCGSTAGFVQAGLEEQTNACCSRNSSSRSRRSSSSSSSSNTSPCTADNGFEVEELQQEAISTEAAADTPAALSAPLSLAEQPDQQQQHQHEELLPASRSWVAAEQLLGMELEGMPTCSSAARKESADTTTDCIHGHSQHWQLVMQELVAWVQQHQDGQGITHASKQPPDNREQASALMPFEQLATAAPAPHSPHHASTTPNSSSRSSSRSSSSRNSVSATQPTAEYATCWRCAQPSNQPATAWQQQQHQQLQQGCY
ncbi:hypothetical protein OEZ86_013275 [Tetradesmus obliquus]|nr:hypothetical protein OEZ86_013275 [Tetradesmus obliquus]